MTSSSSNAARPIPRRSGGWSAPGTEILVSVLETDDKAVTEAADNSRRNGYQAVTLVSPAGTIPAAAPAARRRRAAKVERRSPRSSPRPAPLRAVLLRNVLTSFQTKRLFLTKDFTVRRLASK